MDKAVLGVFGYADVMINAAKKVKEAGYSVSMLSPVPLVHEIEHEMGKRFDFLRFFTLFGGLGGFFGGTVFALGTAVLYTMPRGGRPIFAATPTLIISYESTILAGVLFTMLGFLTLCRLPYFKKKVFEEKIAIDHFGLVIEGVSAERFSSIEKMLTENGASEVRWVEKSTC